MINLTIALYEYPAAQHNIRDWEQEMNEYIIFKKVNRDVITYVLDKKYARINIDGMDVDYEVVMCIPLALCNDNIFEIIQPQLKELSSVFNVKKFLEWRNYMSKKVLIFGRVSFDDVIRIKNFLMEVESNG